MLLSAKPDSYLPILCREEQKAPLFQNSSSEAPSLITSGYNCFFSTRWRPEKTDLSILTLLAPCRDSLCRTSHSKGHVPDSYSKSPAGQLYWNEQTPGGDNPAFTSSVSLHQESGGVCWKERSHFVWDSRRKSGYMLITFLNGGPL